MTLDGFLAVLSIAIAIYALMSPVQKMKARLSIHMQLVLAVGFFAAVLYLEMFETFKLPCVLAADWCSFVIIESPKTINAGQWAFILVLTWMAIAYAIHQWVRPWSSALPAMDKIVNVLLADRKFDELLQFLTPHMKFLAAAAERRFVMQSIHDWFVRLLPSPLGILAVPRAPGKSRKPDNAFVREAKKVLALGRHFVPAENRSEEIAQTILERIVRSDETHATIVKYRPEFAFALLKIRFREKNDFADKFFRDLVADRTSMFYQEMVVELPQSNSEGFRLNPTHRLQDFLFRHCRVAEDLAVWRPVGDYIVELAGGQHGEEYVAKQNGAYNEHATVRDPILMTMRFFDVMVSRAAHQEINYHMWLPYLRHFVEKIVATTSVMAARKDDEFPTLGLHSVYEAFDTLGRWVHLVKYLPDHSIHLNFNHRESASIPMFAAEALGAALKSVLTSKHIPDSFKAYMYACVMRDIKSLAKDGKEGRARAMFIDRIANGGGRNRDPKYLPRIKMGLASIDYILRSDVSDFEDALNRAPNQV